MSDILDRLRKRRFPYISTSAYAGNMASAAMMQPQCGTFTIDTSKPDEDIDDAIKEIKRLRTAQLAAIAAVRHPAWAARTDEDSMLLDALGLRREDFAPLRRA